MMSEDILIFINGLFGNKEIGHLKFGIYEFSTDDCFKIWPRSYLSN